jgi:hypothetical protein
MISSTFGRTPWTGDQSGARPLRPQDSATQKYEKTSFFFFIFINLLVGQLQFIPASYSLI